MRTTLLLLALAGCTPTATRVTPAHPAHPDAETGRLAGPPAALRPGVVTLDAPPPATHKDARPEDHEGHDGHEGHEGH